MTAKRPIKAYLLLLLVLHCSITSLYALTGPTLMIDKNQSGTDYIYGIGPGLKYKKVSAPHDFGGDMTMWGARFFAGRLNDPAIGLMFQAGTLNGRSMKLNLEMTGLTFEDSFREDSRVLWRVTLGAGKYRLRMKTSGLELNKGSFTFFEPMIVGLLPLTRHVVLEFAAGYTFAGSTGVKIEGLALQTELLLGRF